MGWGWAGGRGSQNPTLGQCSRHLSWPAACFPAGFSTSIYFPVRLFHCLSVCLSSYLLECILRFASRNLCCPALYSGLDALDAATRISTLFIFICECVCERCVCVCLLCWLNASWHLVARWSVRSPEASSTFFPVAPNKQRGGCNSCFVPLCRVRKCVGAAGELIFQLYLCNVAATLPSLYLRECVCVCVAILQNLHVLGVQLGFGWVFFWRL